MSNSELQSPLIQPPTDLLTRATDQVWSKIRAAGSSSDAGKRNAELKKAAQEFESLFVAYLLKVMRETIEESGLTEGGLGKDIYTDMFDQEVSRGIAQQGVLGIADILYKRLSAVESITDPEDKNKVPGSSDPSQITQPPVQPTSSAPAHGADPGLEVPDFRLPVQAPISSAFGIRRDPISHRPEFHRGVDIAAPAGTDVRAVLGGEVAYAGYDKGYGNSVVIQHSGGFQTRYAHLEKCAVKAGDTISNGQILGSVGSTGHSTGPHLHFEVTRGGEPLNPSLALAR